MLRSLLTTLSLLSFCLGVGACPMSASPSEAVRDTLPPAVRRTARAARAAAKAEQLAPLQVESQVSRDSIVQYMRYEEQLRDALSALADSLHEAEAHLSSLRQYRSLVADTLLKEYAGVPLLPFAQLTDERLQKLTDACGPHADEPRLRQLLQSAQQAQQARQTYLQAQQQASRPYASAQVNHALSALQQLRGLSPAQQREQTELAATLRRFPAGLAALQQLARAVARDRQSGLITNDVSLLTTLRAALASDRLEQRIKADVLTVPYLSDAYRRLCEAYKQAPAKQPALEAEILHQPI